MQTRSALLFRARPALSWLSPALWLATALTLGTTPVLSQSAAKDAADVRATLVAMWDAIEAGDVERYATYVHPSFTQFGETDTYLSAGKEREVRAMRDYLARVSRVHTEMHQEEITVRGDVAWITYYWTDAGYSGTTRFTSRGKSTRIFAKENGKWLCIHGHYTAVP
jgi:ketosteroid isomerase-like protein